MPDNVEELITTRAQEHATDYPPTGKEPMGAEPLIMRVNGIAVSVQRAYEWIRVLLEYEGDQEELARFKSYTIERGQLLDILKGQLAKALDEPRAEFDLRYDENNRETLAANRKLLEAIAHIPGGRGALARVRAATGPDQEPAGIQQQ